MTRKLLRMAETSRIIDCSYSRTASLIRMGILPAVRLGRQIRVDPNKLQVFIEQGGQALPGGRKRGSLDDQAK